MILLLSNQQMFFRASLQLDYDTKYTHTRLTAFRLLVIDGEMVGAGTLSGSFILHDTNVRATAVVSRTWMVLCVNRI